MPYTLHRYYIYFKKHIFYTVKKTSSGSQRDRHKRRRRKPLGSAAELTKAVLRAGLGQGALASKARDEDTHTHTHTEVRFVGIW